MNPYNRWLANDDTVFQLIEQTVAWAKVNCDTQGVAESISTAGPYRIGEDFEQAADAFPKWPLKSSIRWVWRRRNRDGDWSFPQCLCKSGNDNCNAVAGCGTVRSCAGAIDAVGRAGEILWSTGCTVVHPQHLLQLFWAFQFSDQAMNAHGIPQLNEAIKRMIFGGNYARMIGLDTAEWQAKQVGDAFDGVALKAPVVVLVRNVTVQNNFHLDTQIREVLSQIHSPCSIAAGRPIPFSTWGWCATGNLIAAC